MDLGLNDRVILVSGGGSGIGQAITRLCLAEGARVVVGGRETAEVIAFQQEIIGSNQRRCAFFAAELADPQQCAAVIQFAEGKFGPLYGLVNNAGTNDNVGLTNGSPELFSQSLRENLLHYYALAHFSLPSLIASRGAIINISSKVAVTGQGNTSGYAAAKGAQLALTREWAAELLPYGVRVNAVVPAEVLTPAYHLWLGEQGNALTFEHIEGRVPLGRRMTRPEEIAAAAVFLLSPTQSGHTTAQHVYIDGGYTHLDRALTQAGADES